jgi:FKBP-type peptidyl-prolyl cis-trans isomerase
MKFYTSKILTGAFIATGSMFACMSCVNDDLEELKANENRIIKEYLAVNSGFTKTVGGIYFKELEAGTGLSPADIMEKTKYIFVNYTGRVLETGIIRETSDSSLKSEWTSSTAFDHYLYGPAKIQYGFSMPGINEALSHMKEGGKARVIIPGDQANQDFIPLLYDLELVKVVSDAKVYEDTVVNAFLSKNGFGEETAVDTSMWFKVISSGISEDSVDINDTVYFTYTGWLVDFFYDSVYTRVFDSNSVKYLYNSKITSGTMLLSNSKVPKAVQMALNLMKEGDKARIIAHYEYTFGEKGVVHSKYNYTIIPKLQTVAYDVEITQIK